MIENFFWETLHKLLEFIYAPVIYPNIVYILLPAIAAVGLMELYFKRYPRENLGNHKSMESSLFMIFIAFNLVGVCLIERYSLEKIAVAVLYSLFTVYIHARDFFHKLPIKTYFNVSVKAFLLLISYYSLTLVYGEMLSLSLVNLVEIGTAMILGMAVLVFLSAVFKSLEPRSYEDIERFLNKIEKDVKKMDDEQKEPLSEIKVKPKKVEKKQKKKST